MSRGTIGFEKSAAAFAAAGLPRTAGLVARLAEAPRCDGNSLLTVRRSLANETRNLPLSGLAKALERVLAGRSAASLAKTGGTAPAVDRALATLERGFPILLDGLLDLARSRRYQPQAVHLGLFACSIQWLALEHLSEDFVKHWVSGPEQTGCLAELRTVRLEDGRALQVSAYRQAVVRGSFEVGDDGGITFWTTDALQRSTSLPLIPSTIVLAAEAATARHLSTIEGFARFLAAWSESTQNNNLVRFG